MPSLVRVDKKRGCAWVTLDRPPLNLIVPELIAELRAAFEALARDEGVRAAVVTGAGRAFTAGMQVQVLRDLSPATAKALITSLHEAIHAVHDAPFPTVAMVNGPCLGAGFELAMACDLRVAAAGAQLGLPEVKVGAPSVIEAALLPALVGPGRAAEMLLTGDSIVADQALAWGLVNRVAPAEDLEAVTAALVEKILACAPPAIRLQKELMIRWRNTDLASAVRIGIDAFAQNYTTGEGREAALAFLEKRPAKFE
ncbi:MAG: enoyl-CoA hydratase-related protein [Candidatus Rokubacteria bacterium]|nr:enoyl-CoA hydratase-related protein [Candidatus Rokubacteria bacterium]